MDENEELPTCPACETKAVFHRVGTFRSQCTNCHALVQNAEVNREDLKPL